MSKGIRLGGRQKGTPNKATTEVRELARSLFDKHYWTARRLAIREGTCPPQIEGKLLAYAYGEPKQEHTLNTGITVNIGYLPTSREPLTIDVSPEPHRGKNDTEIDSPCALPPLSGD